MSQLAVISLTADEEQALRAKTRAGTTEHRIAERANIVLLAHRGKTNLEIAEQLDTKPARVSKWRRRFAELGLNGLSLCVLPQNDITVPGWFSMANSFRRR